MITINVFLAPSLCPSEVPCTACLLIVGLLVHVVASPVAVTAVTAVTPVAAWAVPNIQLTINGQTFGTIQLISGVHTITGLPIDGQSGIMAGTSALAMTVDTGNRLCTPVITLVDLDRAVATASGQASIPTEFPDQLAQIPLALAVGVTHAKSDGGDVAPPLHRILSLNQSAQSVPVGIDPSWRTICA